MKGVFGYTRGFVYTYGYLSAAQSSYSASIQEGTNISYLIPNLTTQSLLWLTI